MDARVTARSQPWGSAAVRVLDYPTEPATMEELQTLLGVIEALLLQINAGADSKLGRLHRSGRQALAAAQSAIAPRVGRVREEQEQIASDDDARVRAQARESLWAAVALTGLIVFSIGPWASRWLGRWWQAASRTWHEA
jgi:ElaB/YqjD/DUF883 family membrane-anchored ribosome-binding protein